MLNFSHIYLYFNKFTWTYFCEIYWNLIGFRKRFKNTIYIILRLSPVDRMCIGLLAMHVSRPTSWLLEWLNALGCFRSIARELHSLDGGIGRPSGRPETPTVKNLTIGNRPPPPFLVCFDPQLLVFFGSHKYEFWGEFSPRFS